LLGGVLAVGLVASPAASRPALAADSPPAAAGITVTPGIVNFVLDSKTSVKRQDITLTNGYDVPVRLTAEFKLIDEAGGRLVPVGDIKGPLADSLRVSENDITIPAKAKRDITVQASDLDQLEPGGHYATLLLTPIASTGDASQQLAAGHSSLRSMISITVYLIKQSGAKYDLSLNSASMRRLPYALPDSVTLQFANRGNVHGVPRASVNVMADDSDVVLAHGVANSRSVPLLPGKTTTESVKLATVHQLWRPQHLRLQVAYRFDGQAEARVMTTRFWYVPAYYIFAVPMVIVALVAGVLTLRPHARKLYRSANSRRHQRRKHPVPTKADDSKQSDG
jgi:hypothetical protein